MKVPFNRLAPSRSMADVVSACLDAGHWSGDGGYTQRVLEKLQALMPASRLLMTTSASQALEMGAHFSGLGAGDEVILPSYTYTSCANAVLSTGAVPVFAAVDPQTLCLDPESVARLISSKTCAVMAVHYGGVSADLERLSALCRDRGLALIEDAAQAIGSTYCGKPLGSIGDFGAISFHDTKNITSGEGGLFLMSPSQAQRWEQAQMYHQKGTDRLKFLKGLTDRYEWVGRGVSASPSELLMALLLPQLEALSSITEQRRAVVRRYEEILTSRAWPEILSFTRDCPEGNGHLFFVRFRSSVTAAAFMTFMQIREVDVRTHYQPLHAAPFGCGFRRDPALESARDREMGACVVRLPMSHHFSESEIDYVCEVLKDALIHCHTGL